MTENTSIFANRLKDLRHAMAAEKLDGTIVPRTDEYQGEYVPAYAERLKWLTGFSGSAGVAVILKDTAVVMSDGRYTIQLEQQIDKSLYTTEDNVKTPVEDWLLGQAEENDVIGFDPKLFTPNQIQKIQSKLKDRSISLRSVSNNLVDAIWNDQPASPLGTVKLFPEEFAGLTYLNKLDLLLSEMKEKKTDALILTLSDSIAWFLNIRGSDVPHIPVALSYLVLTGKGQVSWFIAEEKVGKDIRNALGETVTLYPPGHLEPFLKKMGEKGQTVWIDPKRSSLWFHELIEKSGGQVFEGKDPCIDIRSQKTEAEQKAMKAAHIRDGVALTKFLRWLSMTNEQQDELSVEAKLQSFRAEAPEFLEPSFDTIAGFGPNGAIVHYRATEETCQELEEGSLLLVDSGGQYIDGTTDVTRTIALGIPSDEMRENFTLVLKGHIAVATAKFKRGALGKEIDALARKPLQDKGLDFAHGTGHGVGCNLSVHEEAAHLSPRGEEAPQPGMILSNEPGYYKEGQYGIRIENLVLVKESKEKDMLEFETITLAPLDKSLIEKEILSEEEAAWVNNYHAKVYKTLAPSLDSETASWLKDACKPL